jgi:hypothetical protein
MDMFKTLFFLPLLWAVAPPSSWAQAAGSVLLDPTTTLQASQPGSPVPPVAYRSAFADLPQGLEQTPTDWKAANAAVGQFKRGHADLLKWEQDQARKNAAPAKPAPAAAEAKP